MAHMLPVRKRACPVTVRVRCMDTYHLVTWQNHRLVLHDHPERDVVFLELLNTATLCVQILQTIRINPIERPTGFPRRLWKAVQDSFGRLYEHRVGPLEERLQGRVSRAKIRVRDPALRLSTEAPLVAVWTDNLFEATGRPLAIRRGARWEVDWGMALEFASSLVPPGCVEDPNENRSLWAETELWMDVFFWSGCKPCGHRAFKNCPPSMDAAPTPGLRRHSRTQRHRQRVLAEIATVFEVDLPPHVTPARHT